MCNMNMEHIPHTNMSKRPATTDVNRDNWDQEDEPEEQGMFQKADEEVLRKRVIKTAKRRMGLGGTLGGAKSSPFSGFSGFGSTDTTSASAASPFSFLNKTEKPGTDGITKTADESGRMNFAKALRSSEPKTLSGSPILNFKPKGTTLDVTFNASEAKSVKADGDGQESDAEKTGKTGTDSAGNNKKSESLEILKDLNLSCNSWITEHLEKNPYCILTPIFRDYEKHLAQLDLDTDTGEKKENSVQLPKPPAPAQTENSDTTKLFLFGTTDTSVKTNTTTATETKEGNNEKASEFKIIKDPGKIEFSGPKTSFPFAGFMSQPKDTTINLNVGGSSGGGGEQQKEGGGDDSENESDEPPKSDFTPVVEEDSIYDKRCKVFVKKGSSFESKGIGTLYLKPVNNGKNTQLLIRADNSSGTLLLNVLIGSNLPVSKMGKNNVMLVCVPTPESKPPPVSVLLKVKTAEDCIEVIEKLEECKRS